MRNLPPIVFLFLIMVLVLSSCFQSGIGPTPTQMPFPPPGAVVGSQWAGAWAVDITGAGAAGTDYVSSLLIGKGDQPNAAGYLSLGGNATDYPNDIAITSADQKTELDHYMEPYGRTSNASSWTIMGNAVDSSGVMWAFKENGSYGYSTNLGVSWTETATVQASGYNTPTHLFIDSSDSFFYAANGTTGWGIYKSTNDGTTWTEKQALVLSTPGGTYVGGFAAQSFTEITNHPGNSSYEDYLFCGLYSADGGDTDAKAARIYRSTDGGDNWTQVFPAGAPVDRHVHLVQADPYTGYVYSAIGDYAAGSGGDGRKTIRSIDGGTNWTELWNEEGGAERPRKHFTGIDFDQYNRYFAEDYFDGRIYKTTDDSALTELWEPGTAYTVGFTRTSMNLVQGSSNETSVMYMLIGRGGAATDDYNYITMSRFPYVAWEVLHKFDPGTYNRAMLWDWHNPDPYTYPFLINSGQGMEANSTTTFQPCWKADIEVAADSSTGETPTIHVFAGKSGATSQSNAANTYLFWDDAESGTFLDKYDLSGTPSTYEYQTDYPAFGSKSIQIEADAAAYEGVTTDDTFGPGVAIEYWCRKLVVGFHQDSLFAVSIFNEWDSGEVYYYDSTTGTDSTEDMTVTAYMPIVMRNDAVLEEWDFELKGAILYADDADWYGSSGAAVWKMVVNGATHDVYYDNIRIRPYVKPEPSVGTPAVATLIGGIRPNPMIGPDPIG